MRVRKAGARNVGSANGVEEDGRVGRTVANSPGVWLQARWEFCTPPARPGPAMPVRLRRRSTGEAAFASEVAAGFKGAA